MCTPALSTARITDSGCISTATFHSAVHSPCTTARSADSACLPLACLPTALQEEARQLFRNPECTEFVIVTIPTIMAISESSRLAASLRQEDVPLRTIVINQVRPGRCTL